MFTAAELDAIWLSLLVATVAVVASLPLGIGLGWLLARRHFRGKSLLETLLHLPLVLPPVVTGYLLLVLFGRHGWLGEPLERWLGIRLVFDWKGAALAAAMAAFPLMVRSIRLAFSGVDPRLVQAARTLGASRWNAFRTVTLPLASHGIVAGAVLAFARSLGECGATIMIAGNIPGVTQTIPLLVYTQLETPGGLKHARGIVVVSIVLAAGALAVGEYLERRGRARLGTIHD